MVNNTSGIEDVLIGEHEEILNGFIDGYDIRRKYIPIVPIRESQ